MKKLILIRHAEPQTTSPSGRDADRELNQKGIADAGKMAAIFKIENIEIDLILTSTAARTRQTAKIFADTLDMDEKLIQVTSRLYGASVFDFYSVVERIPAQTDSVAIFSHNPGISGFANDLECSSPVRLAPCSCFGISIETLIWMDFQVAEKHFLFFKSPE